MSYNAGERKDIRRAEKVAKTTAQQRAEVVVQLMSTIPGRAYIFDQLESAHIFRTSFALEPVQMAFNEGERNQGLRLLGDIVAHCPDLYILMMREANERSAAAERGSRQDRDGRVEGADTADDGDDGDAEAA